MNKYINCDHQNILNNMHKFAIQYSMCQAVTQKKFPWAHGIS